MHFMHKAVEMQTLFLFKILIGKREMEMAGLRNLIIELTSKLTAVQDADPDIEELVKKIKEGN